jgi:hypothetical protein
VTLYYISIYFSIDLILAVALIPGVDSATNGNEYQEPSSGQSAAGAYGRQPRRRLCMDCPENDGASTSHKPMGLHGRLRDNFNFFFLFNILMICDRTVQIHYSHLPKEKLVICCCLHNYCRDLQLTVLGTLSNHSPAHPAGAYRMGVTQCTVTAPS